MTLNVFHHVRNAVNWTLTPLGIAIERTNKMKWRWKNSIVETQVGRYTIQIPGINPLSSYYLAMPTLASQLGTLTSIVRGKYPSMGVVDVGANVGDTACIIKSAEEVPLLCIEGDDKSFSFLEKNMRQFQNTKVHKLVLSEKSGTLAARFEKTGWNTTINPSQTGATESIKVISFDDFIQTQPDRDNYKLLKIDTEGFDCAIIRGSLGFIQEVRPVIFFEYNRENMDAIGEPGLETLAILAELGYSRIMFHDSRGRFIGSMTLADRDGLKDWHDYVDGKKSEIYYLDITVFHEQDTDIAMQYLETERTTRRSTTE